MGTNTDPLYPASAFLPVASSPTEDQWLAASVAIMTCDDVAKLRRVIRMAEQRIAKLEEVVRL